MPTGVGTSIDLPSWPFLLLPSPCRPRCGFVLGIEAEMQQRVVVLAGDQENVAAAAAVAAAGAAAGDELLAPERKAAVAAVAGLDRDDDFIDEHTANCLSKTRWPVIHAAASTGPDYYSAARC